MNHSAQTHSENVNSAQPANDGGLFKGNPTKSNTLEIPQISLPKGGGALKGIDEKFQVNAANGTASFTIPVPLSAGRNGFQPALNLSYNSGAGNGIFGLGWSLDFPTIQRKTDKKLPEYDDDLDVFLFSGVEDLVLVEKQTRSDREVWTFRPRIEGLFARIEQIRPANGTPYWKVITKENVVTIFGKSNAHRVADPEDTRRIFSWLPELSYDDKGSCLVYAFKAEDRQEIIDGVFENNRAQATAQKYLQKVRYGNLTPYYPENGDNTGDFHFEVVLDYGEYDASFKETQIWVARADAFSDYRSGFEARTYRLCQKILVFHNHFSELKNGERCLVRSLDLEYSINSQENDPPAEVTYLKTVTQTGYLWKDPERSYSSKSLPQTTFDYQPLQWDNTIRTIKEKDAIHLPAGLSSGYQWVDLYNEGISGILTEQATGWYYKSNLGNGDFSPARLISPKPSLTGLNEGVLQLQDLEADGSKQLVVHQPGLHGFYSLSDEEEWEPFQSFHQLPNIDFNDPYLRMIDLNGDGQPELVISQETVFCWYPSKGKIGYDSPQLTPKSPDEEQGPAIVFADQLQTIYLADMSGDGLTDVVRIRNEEICYWPNLGYGRFGKKVSMANAPTFDAPDRYNPAYLHLADVTGTGATDLIYLGKNTYQAYLNLSGNTWSDAHEISPFPEVAWPNQFSVTDFLGNGTSCLVISSPLPSQPGLRYIDLMGGKKPHVMIGHKNGMGKETKTHFQSSTFYYLEDKKAGTPWLTKLPFPVQCVAKVEVKDVTSGLYFSNEYSYHHGYYDHAEREFRGFGRVDQTDTEKLEDWNPENPNDWQEYPIRTRTWFDTGSSDVEGAEKYRQEYWYYKAGEVDVVEPELPGTLFLNSTDWTTDERREARRACKGMVIRQEVFAQDGSDKAKLPYSVATHNTQVQLLQPRRENPHAVFLVTESEAITLSYERTVADPRIAHAFNLEIDELGNVLRSVSVVYGRRSAATDLPNDIREKVQTEQARLHITLSENDYTNDVTTERAYRLRQLWQTKTYEVNGLLPSENGLFSISSLRKATGTLPKIAYHESVSGTQKRLIEHVMTRFRQDEDTEKPLAFGQMQSLGIPYENYQLAFTSNLLTNRYGERALSVIELREAGYLDLTDTTWWVRSGVVHFSGNPKVDWYMPLMYEDPFGNRTNVAYDLYQLLLKSSEDALRNRAEVLEYDYRTLSPVLMQDPNGNQSKAVSDELGLVVGTAILGKGTEADSLDGFEASLSVEQITAFFATATPHELAPALLANASSRLLYDFTTQPTKVAGIVREKHVAQLKDGEQSPLQISVEFSDGMGNVLLKKVQAEGGGTALKINKSVTPCQAVEIEVAAYQYRWIGNGRTILNNKGKPIRQYEPYFSVNPFFEDEPCLCERGVTTEMHYDSAGRLVRTDFPDKTLARVEYDNWHQLSFDQNDTVPESGWKTIRENPDADFLKKLQAIGSDLTKEKEALAKTLVHSNTPVITYVDSLGRPFCTQTDAKLQYIINGRTEPFSANQLHYNYVDLDLEGNPLRVVDARGNAVMTYTYDMLGHAVYQESPEAGERWLFNDAMGKPQHLWDSRQQHLETNYDELHRPKEVWLNHPTLAQSVLVEAFVYGELTEQAAANNLRGQLYQHYDQSGLVRNDRFDFKGNLLKTTRQLAKLPPAEAYRIAPNADEIERNKPLGLTNWHIDRRSTLLEMALSQQTRYDALNRMVRLYSWHSEAQRIPASVYVPAYSLRGTLFAEGLYVQAVLNPDSDGPLPTDPLKAIITAMTYDAKGQRQEIRYGNGTKTTYHYDPETFRLIGLKTVRQNSLQPVLQDLHYTYDPTGNILIIEDKAQPTKFCHNQIIEARNEYTYDSLYRLVKAIGREHLAQATFGKYDNWNDNPFRKSYACGDEMAWQEYKEYYQYDPAGNFLSMQHAAGVNSWTRTYKPDTTSNRLNSTAVTKNETNEVHNYPYPQYNPHGSLTQMPHLQAMRWDFTEHLCYIECNACDDPTLQAYYQYDSRKQRSRKVVVKGNIREERQYWGGFEIYRSSIKNDGKWELQLERHTQQLVDGSSRVLLIDTRTVGTDAFPKQTYRYQYGNHLGSASLEIDEQANIITYEEYHPYGTTAYQANNKTINATAKRYRYTGMERDDETGLNYHTSRYYAPWLGRWISADSIGIEGGMNVYGYCNCEPIQRQDKSGFQSEFGTVATYNQQGPALRSSANIRLSEHEHLAARINLYLATLDQEARLSAMNERLYRNMTTITTPYDMARIKTRLDMQLRGELRQALRTGVISSNFAWALDPESIVNTTLRARDEAIQARLRINPHANLSDLRAVTEDRVRRAAHLQFGEMMHATRGQRLNYDVDDVEQLFREFDQNVRNNSPTGRNATVAVLNRTADSTTSLTMSQSQATELLETASRSPARRIGNRLIRLIPLADIGIAIITYPIEGTWEEQATHVAEAIAEEIPVVGDVYGYLQLGRAISDVTGLTETIANFSQNTGRVFEDTSRNLHHLYGYSF